MSARHLLFRAILSGMALVFLLVNVPERGHSPSITDRHALEVARENGDDMLEWRLLARFVSADPQDSALWERLGILDHRNGLCVQAIFEFNQARQLGDLDSSSLIPYGECLVELGKFEEAVNLLSAYNDAAAGPAGLELLLSRAYLRLGDGEKALKIIDTWAERGNGEAGPIYYQGLYQALYNPTKALNNLQKAAELSVVYENAYRQVQTAINQGQLQENQAYQALELGRAYGSLGEWELAEYAFQTAVQFDPQYAEAHAWLAEAQQQLGGDGSAELATALSLNPDSILVQAISALALQRQGNTQSAVNFLENIVAQEPENPQWLMALGQSRAIAGNLEGALVALQQATILQPVNITAWQALAEFCLAYQYEVSSVGIPAANKSVILAPDNPISLDLAGQAALLNGRLSEAEEYFNKAIEHDPRYAQAHLHLAQVLLQHESYLSAVAELEKAAALGSPEAKKLLEQLDKP